MLHPLLFLLSKKCEEDDAALLPFAIKMDFHISPMNGKPKLWQNPSKPENLIVIFSLMRSSV